MEKDLKLELKPYTLIVMVGPSGCGKSTLAARLKGQLADCEVVSSDALRESLLPEGASDREMEEVSKQAFDLLRVRLQVLMSWPVRRRYVVVDSTALNDKFRDSLLAMAETAGYYPAMILFDYKTKRDYTQHLGEYQAEVAARHVERLRKDVLPNLKSRMWHAIVRIRSMQAGSNLVVQESAEAACFGRTKQGLPDDVPIAVIGDVHENVPALRALLARLPSNAVLVFVGDLLDKGQQTEEMLQLLQQVQEAWQVFMVEGNHENYLRRALEDPESVTGNNALSYFSALPVLEADPALREQFLKLHDQMLPWLHVPACGHRPSLYVTHAPCLQKHIGNPRFTREMRNFRIDRDQPLQPQLKPVLDEAENGLPLHVFGHVPHAASKVRFRNQVWLDTGYQNGGRLSAFVLHGDRAYTVEVTANDVPPKVLLPEELPTSLLPVPALPAFEQYELTPNDTRFLRKFMEGGAQYISGTMPPCPSVWNNATGELELESLAAGLDYFREKEIDKVVLEPKYMGSRCQLYLKKGHPEACFAATRNGMRITWLPELQVLLETWLDKCSSLPGIQWESELVLDGELLPWMALGETLIEKDFFAYERCVSSELQALKDDEAFADLDLGKYAIPLDESLEQLELYRRQLALYAQPGELDFKPFAVLQVDGKAPEPNQLAGWSAELNSDPVLQVDLQDASSLAAAQQFFDTLTSEKGMEGVVIKPLVPKAGHPPYMKCRNPGYLTLIYGYDYRSMPQYAELVKSKRIGGKLGLSIKEYELGQKLLQTSSEEDRKQLACALLFEIKKEESLDPRL